MEIYVVIYRTIAKTAFSDTVTEEHKICRKKETTNKLVEDWKKAFVELNPIVVESADSFILDCQDGDDYNYQIEVTAENTVD